MRRRLGCCLQEWLATEQTAPKGLRWLGSIPRCPQKASGYNSLIFENNFTVKLFLVVSPLPLPLLFPLFPHPRLSRFLPLLLSAFSKSQKENRFRFASVENKGVNSVA